MVIMERYLHCLRRHPSNIHSHTWILLQPGLTIVLQQHRSILCYLPSIPLESAKKEVFPLVVHSRTIHHQFKKRLLGEGIVSFHHLWEYSLSPYSSYSCFVSC